MHITVSVVITSFNQGELIRQAVDSALAQTLRPDEIIVVDDGSDDPASLEVLSQLASCFDTKALPPDMAAVYGRSDTEVSIRILRQPNAGPSAARNTGIRAAHGEYVCVLDGDDRLLPMFLERTMAVLAADPHAVAASGWLRTFGTLDSVVRPSGGPIEAFLARNCCPATCLLRREIWALAGGYDETMRQGFEDWDCSLSLLEAGGANARIVVVPEPLVEYRTAPASPNITSMNKRLELMRFIIAKHHAVYAAHLAEAIVSIEETSIQRLALWERAVRARPDLIDGTQAEPTSADFMAHPTYGDGGMAAAVRIRSLDHAVVADDCQ